MEDKLIKDEIEVRTQAYEAIGFEVYQYLLSKALGLIENNGEVNSSKFTGILYSHLFKDIYKNLPEYFTENNKRIYAIVINSHIQNLAFEIQSVYEIDREEDNLTEVNRGKIKKYIDKISSLPELGLKLTAMEKNSLHKVKKFLDAYSEKVIPKISEEIDMF